MAQQTINIGASPNDGTGTPLRTSFDYTNQNFTELYTALGGGVGLPGATTQVIFNDGGTNLAGDAGLVYNKTTDALTVAGLVTAGSATITGAATVGTTLGVTGVSTLTGNAFANGSYTVTAGTPGAFANAALTINNRSGVGDLSLIALGYRPNGTVLNGAAYMGYIGTNDSGTGLGDLIFGTRNVTTDTAPTERYRIDSTGIATWQNVGGVAGTAMTLNSTGLGIGTATIPFKLTVASPGSSNTMCLVNTSSNVSRLVFGTFTVPGDSWTAIEGDARATGYFAIRTNDTERLRVDTSGNVGIGSTSPNSRLQIVGATDDALVQSCIRFSRKGYESSTMGVSISASGGSAASQNNLVFNTSDGTNAPAERVRIDGDGNLLVGTVTAPAGTKVGAIAKLSGVSLEGTGAITVSTTPVALARIVGTGGLFFVSGYNLSGGNQGWWLVATTGGAITPTVIASGNNTGLTVAFTIVAGIVYMNTVSGTLSVTSFAVTN